MQRWQVQAGQQSELHLSLPDTAAEGLQPGHMSVRPLAAAPHLGMLKAVASELGPQHQLTASAGDTASAQSPAHQHSHVAGSLFGVQLRGSVLLQPRLLAQAHLSSRQRSGHLASNLMHAAAVPQEVGVTGGLGALGLLLASWLCTQGSRSIHLLGRSGRADASSLRSLLAPQVCVHVCLQ